jgi:hypothetical protein
MLDFTPVRNKELTLIELTEGLTLTDLRYLTNEMVDAVLALIAECQDADVTYPPSDPTAYDDAAVNESEIHMPWTLGHLIVHITASAEEAAFMATELARGVPYQPRRSRSERHWSTVTTIEQCRHRLEESRRMRLATLDIWPDRPYLDNTYVAKSGATVGPIQRFVHGLSHDDAHLNQIADVVQQAKQARATIAAS